MVRAAALFLALGCLTAVAAPPGDVRRAVQRAMAVKEPRARAGALDAALDGADSEEAARSVAELVFRADEPQVVLDVGVLRAGRMRSDGAVLALANEAESPVRLRRVLVADALGRGATTPGTTALTTMLRHADARTRAAAAAALGRRRDASSCDALHAALDDPEWTVRSAAVAALRSIGEARSTGPLASRIRREDGRLVDDVTWALRRLVSPPQGGFDDLAGYERAAGVPEAEIAARPRWTPPPAAIDGPLVALRTERVLFVLCVAETMKDTIPDAAHDAGVVADVARSGEDLADALRDARTKLDVARVHLRAMLRRLRDGVEFDVLTYGASPAYAFGDWTPAGPDSRRRAETRIARLSPGGDPGLDEALRRIFDPRGKDPYDADDGPDTVVMFTDGALAPTGPGSDRHEVGTRAERWNRVRQIRFVWVATGRSEPAVMGLLTSGSPGGISLQVP